MSAPGPTEAQLHRVRELRARGYTCYRTARMAKVPIEWVRAVCPPKTGRYAVIPYNADEIRALRRQGLSYIEIGAQLSLNEYTVRSVCAGIVLTPEQRFRIQSDAAQAGTQAAAKARREEARKRADAKRAERTRRRSGPIKLEPSIIQIPAWVPTGHLRDLYQSIAERDCEEQAAIVVRTLKRGGSVAWL